MARIKTEGGNTRGHSNMEHYDRTEVIKRRTRKARRRAGKEAAKEE